MLRERFSKLDFEKLFQAFNTAVYHGEMEKLNYKSWRNIRAWILDEKWEQMEVTKEWVRRYDSDSHPYDYHDEEKIFIGPYDHNVFYPNPEELDPNDNSFGTWLDRVLNKNAIMTKLSTSMADVSYSATTVADSLQKLNDALDYTYLDSSGYEIGSLNTNSIQPYTYELNTDGLRINGMSIEKYIEKTVNNINDKKENKQMLKFDFGPVDSSVHMSMYGMAIKNASGAYVAYDTATKQIMDVDILNFEGANKFIYKMPATLSQIAVGDVVIHARKPMFVQEVRKDNRLCVMDIFDGEEKTIVPAKSPFGFDFVTKVVSLFNFNGTADASNPFGNMLPFLLMSDSNSKDTENLLPLMLMAGGNMDMSNPMMLYFLCGKGTMDPVALALMSGAFNKPAHNCTCGDTCACKENK